MLKSRLLALTLAMVFVLSLGSVAMASTFEDGATVGQDAEEGTVTRVEFDIIEVGGYTWYLVMPYRGDFGGDSYLDDGWIMNVYTDRQGNLVLYTFVHETDPRWSEDLTPIWGSWGIYKAIFVGKSFSAGR